MKDCVEAGGKTTPAGACVLRTARWLARAPKDEDPGDINCEELNESATGGGGNDDAVNCDGDAATVLGIVGAGTACREKCTAMNKNKRDDNQNQAKHEKMWTNLMKGASEKTWCEELPGARRLWLNRDAAAFGGFGVGIPLENCN